MEYGQDSLSLQLSSIHKFKSFVIVDDLLATGGTAKCIKDLLETQKKKILSLHVVIELSKLGGSSINLLFLDEITGVLDDEGKDKLIEVLQNENDLNVFLISHDFTHPLIDKISIVKNDNISSIQ